MIKFSSIQWKNFLSTGNDWTKIDLARNPSTLIVGQNGSGKSTLLDALSFALFGKPHRNINKPQLVNSINNKNCEVEVSFSIGSQSFRIVRGLKPAKFEIWQNGVMINQDSTSRDYQKYLEQTVIKLNHKSFHQIVVLGSSSFIPFMQLPAHHRREVIEDLLDIQIFSKMNQILKEKEAKLKEDLKDITYNIDLTKEKIALQKKYIDDISALNEDQIKSKNLEITKNENVIFSLRKDNEDWTKFISDNLTNITDAIKDKKLSKDKLIKSEGQFQQSMKSLVKDAKFYEDNETCPTCTQQIDSSIRDAKVSDCKQKAKDVYDGLQKVKIELDAVESEMNALNEALEKVNTLNGNILGNNKSIKNLEDRINDLRVDIESLGNSKGDLATANSELAYMNDQLLTLSERRGDINDQKAYNVVASEMLKDTGIKTKVIKQYLPVMNTLINKYLQVLDFFVSFNLDESFNETIKSRYRDSFNYASFSEGEKQRIDLSLLFTWRQIAKMKNSVSTNLLVLDETFDSSLDHDGVDNLMKILYTLDADTNVFVISHKGDVLDSKFRNKITFKKELNFSKIS